MKKAIILTLIILTTSRAGEIPRGIYVSGYVKNAETGQGIYDALVVVIGPLPSDVTVAWGPTDHNGGYFVEINQQGFQPGMYKVGAFTPGYYNFPTPEHEIYINSQDMIYFMDDIEKLWNPPPSVDAGTDISTTDLFTPQTVQLNGSVTDDGTIVSIWWSANGPGNASFLDSSDPKTTVTFDALGRYELELTALDDIGSMNNDTMVIELGVEPPAQTGHHGGDRFSPMTDCAVCHGENLTGESFGNDWAPSCYDCHGAVWITTNEPPIVDAGPDQSIDCDALPCSTTLAGSASDPDNYPAPLTIEWVRIDGPGTVTFSDSSNPTTTAQFSALGTYILALTAYDGEATVVDQVQIILEDGTVTPPPGYRPSRRRPI